MTARSPLPERLGPEFSVRTARAEGLSRQRLTRADLTSPFHGVRMRADSDSLSRHRSLALILPDGAAFSGSTAAMLWGLPLPRGMSDGPLRVSSFRPVRAIRRPGVHSSQRTVGEVTLRLGLPVLSPEQTLVSLAGALGLADLTAVADRLISGTLKAPALTSREALIECAVQNRGVPAIRSVRCAIEDARAPVWSRPESLLRCLIVSSRLPEPVPNFEVRLARGTAAVDLAWPQFRVFVEYDGYRHHRSRADLARDVERFEELVDLGWLGVRARSRQLFGEPGSLIDVLVRRLASRGFSLGHSIDLTQIPRYSP